MPVMLRSGTTPIHRAAPMLKRHDARLMALHPQGHVTDDVSCPGDSVGGALVPGMKALEGSALPDEGVARAPLMLARSVTHACRDLRDPSSRGSDNWHTVHDGPCPRTPRTGNTATCLRPRRISESGKLGMTPRLHRLRQCHL